jgi:N-acetylglucosamine-6-phosphate deacetylase
MRLGVAAALVDGELIPGDVAIADGAIAAVGLAGGGRGIAAPGFVDLQVNGFAGVDLMRADRDGYEVAGAALLAGGVTAYRPTFVTAPAEELAAALRGVPGERDWSGPRVLGAHVEGPFISARRLGAHAAEWRRDPDPGLLARLLDAGPVSEVTLAPELPGALALVDTLVARGILVSAGHSDAPAADARMAFDRGVRAVTHLFNAMRPPAARDPGIAFAALARPGVTIQLIADGHHVAADALLVAWHAARGRVALVTDAVAAAGMGDGEFELGGRRVVAVDGVVRGPDGQLAGSALTMLGAVRHMHGLGVPLAEALAAASAVPARLASRPDLGRLAPGAPADVVVLDDALEVVRVLVEGAERANR